MSYLLAVVLAVLLAFSYKIVDLTVGVVVGRVLYRKIQSEIVYVWGILLTAIIFFYEDNYVFRLPTFHQPIVLIVLITALTNVFISRYSGYKPSGKKNILNFVIMYPIFEEVIFRGMIIPLLNHSLPINRNYELLYLPVTTQILISSFLFAVAHLQYYSFNKASIRYMLYAFCGGIIFGMIANYTQSIVICIVLHVQFNLLAFLYSKKSTAK